jgi:hypothetical protein
MTELLVREEQERLELLQEDLRFVLERLHQWQAERPGPAPRAAMIPGPCRHGTPPR